MQMINLIHLRITIRSQWAAVRIHMPMHSCHSTTPILLITKLLPNPICHTSQRFPCLRTRWIITKYKWHARIARRADRRHQRQFPEHVQREVIRDSFKRCGGPKKFVWCRTGAACKV